MMITAFQNGHILKVPQCGLLVLLLHTRPTCSPLLTAPPPNPWRRSRENAQAANSAEP